MQLGRENKLRITRSMSLLDFHKFFVDKVAGVQASTDCADNPVFIFAFNEFKPVDSDVYITKFYRPKPR